MPRAKTEAMQKHLEEISLSVAAKAHGVIIMDGAGWHKSGAVKDPENLSFLFLPPHSPELNPTENNWQFLLQT
jgi:transposase